MWRVQENFGTDVLIHWEDFGSSNAARFLERYRSSGPTFNDDIQSTAAVALAALLGAARLAGVPPLAQQTFMFVGAGQASLGIAALLVQELVDSVCSAEPCALAWHPQQRAKCSVVRSGCVVRSRRKAALVKGN